MNSFSTTIKAQVKRIIKLEGLNELTKTRKIKERPG